MTLENGTPAPDFTLRDQHGQSVRLGSFRGDRVVVLVFYPFAFSRVCTGELTDLRDRAPATEADDVAVLGLSCEPVYTLRAFAESLGVEFPLLSDFWPHGAVARAYGVFDEERGCPTRSTYIVDRDGLVRWQVHNASPDARSLEEYERVLRGLRGGVTSDAG